MMTVPELSPDTLVNDCYLIKKTLGQGGFGRTYLAMNKQRYNETCVLKEFLLSGSNQAALQKSLELFKREAETLYQLDHPQIPKFLAVFEAEGRPFLVQEYIHGKNYWNLLEDRKKKQQFFSEQEVIQLLESLLPVLNYIHGKNIFHRDISPDNIMQPHDSTKSPVLIDFGVVKQTIAQTYRAGVSGSVSSGGTFVGKHGYAPQEQMRGGQCSPSSDLYALAVTAIVLLTGKTPDLLFNNSNLEWNWESYVNVSPKFAQILKKMLADKPVERFQSATEVIEALSKTRSRNQPSQKTELSPSIDANQQTKIANNNTYYKITAIVVLLLLGGVSLAFISPHITPICIVLNNCYKDKEYEVSYTKAYQEADAAQIFADSAKSISELQDSEQRLKDAIAQLTSIPQEAKVYPQVQGVLPNYQNQLKLMEERLNKDKKAEQQFNDAEKIASEALEKYNTTSSVQILTESKKSLQEAQEQLKSIPSGVFLDEKVKYKLNEYNDEIKKIEDKIIGLTPTPSPQATVSPVDRCPDGKPRGLLGICNH